MNYDTMSFDWNPANSSSSAFLLSRMEEIAGVHAQKLGVGIEELMAKGQSWVMLAMNLKTYSQPNVGECIHLKTWPSQILRFFTFRDFEFTNTSGELIGQARTQWVLFDLNNRKPLPLPDHLEELVKNAPRVFDFSRVRINSNAEWPVSLSITVAHDHTDVNEHVNNKNYISWAMRAITERNKDKLPKALEIEFQKEAFVGDRLTVETVQINAEVFQSRISRRGEILSVCQFEA